MSGRSRPWDAAGEPRHGGSAASRSRWSRGSSSLLAHGEPMVWLTGGMLVICLVMILGLLSSVAWFGLLNFWPGPVERVIVGPTQTAVLGEPDQTEWFEPTPEFLEKLDASGRQRAHEASIDGRLLRRRLRTGNFQLSGSQYTWVDEFQSTSTEHPEWAMVIEQFEGGRMYGVLRGVRVDSKDEGIPGDARAAWEWFQKHHPAVLNLRDQAESQESEVVGPVNRGRGDAELALKAAEIRFGASSAEWRAAADNLARVSAEAEQKLARMRRAVDAIRSEANRSELVIDTTTRPGYSVPLANIVRAYPANRLSMSEKWSIYGSRWWEFLSCGPREGNAAGGVFPALVGTLAMTMLMSIAVVPLGVMAAVYLREYAKAGLVVSITRIAINNLAGVPSIVFGVFGLGFFVYVCGVSIDEMFFPIRPTSAGVFGQGGVLWASLTLALLTLPVVIVATEEAISAVPNSLREGSYACGASKWQTVRRIVLPRAMPGVLTGLILAIARGAGEVAPLMLVGVASYAPKLPFDGEFPFVHPERQFMHLAYSIYWTSTQSPNSEAARPLVFTMTLVLIVLIAVLNLLAIWLRTRLRRRFLTSAF